MTKCVKRHGFTRVTERGVINAAKMWEEMSSVCVCVCVCKHMLVSPKQQLSGSSALSTGDGGAPCRHHAQTVAFPQKTERKKGSDFQTPSIFNRRSKITSEQGDGGAAR